MFSLQAITGNFPLMMAFCGWCTAQILKFIITFIANRDEWSFAVLFSSGGMPSSHSATVCALTTAVALNEGFASPLFAITAVLSFIVMYDAMGVRRSAGEQAQTLNQIIQHLFDQKQIPIDTTVKEILGHTPSQVLIGAIIGIAIPIIAKFTLKI